MNLRLAAVAVVAVVLLAAGGVAAYLYGVGPLNEDPAADLEEPPEAPEYGDDGGDDGGDTEGDDDDGEDDEVESGPPFNVVVQEITECGTRCRDVTAELTRTRSTAASDVVVYTRIYAGTEVKSSALVWAGDQDVGDIDAGETLETTRTIELSTQKANMVRREDGVVTVQTTVTSQEDSARFTEEWNVM
ncbi:MAG: hypothetical protein ACOCT0_06560 [Halobacteriota archaeon]